MSNEKSSNLVTDFLKTEQQTTKKIPRITLTARTYLNTYRFSSIHKPYIILHTSKNICALAKFIFRCLSELKTECECKSHL